MQHICASFPVPLKDRRLLDVKLGELMSWIMMRDFTPSGIGGAFQRGQCLGRMNRRRMWYVHVPLMYVLFQLLPPEAGSVGIQLGNGPGLLGISLDSEA